MASHHHYSVIWSEHLAWKSALHLELLKGLSARRCLWPLAIQPTSIVPGLHCLSWEALLSQLSLPVATSTHTTSSPSTRTWPSGSSLSTSTPPAFSGCTAKSWSLILFFSLVVHGLLAALFSFTMLAMLCTLDMRSQVIVTRFLVQDLCFF